MPRKFRLKNKKEALRILRERLEERAQQERLYIIANQSINAVLSFNKDAHITWANKAARLLLANDALAELENTNLRDYLLPDDVLFIFSDHVIQQLNEQGRYAIEMNILTRDQRLLPMQAEIVLNDPNAKQDVYLVYLTDISERLHYEEQLFDTASEALRASQAKSDFLSRMSHEIRTPLNAIMGMTQIGQRAEDPAKAMEVLPRIELASQHLLNLVNDILDMSSIETGALTLIPRDFSMNEVLDRVLQNVQAKAAEKELIFTFNDKTTSKQLLNADMMRITQMLTNLLSNAIKFTTKGEVELTITESVQDAQTLYYVFQIRDTGIGMSDEQLERLFQSFEQTDDKIATKFGGMGLGLVITNNLAQMMQGRVDVQSELGVGSTFTLHLPLPLAAISLADNPSKQLTTQNGDHKSRLLLTDDVEINREIVCQMLADLPIDVDQAKDGQEALNMFLESSPGHYQLVLMDIQMPEMDGYEATKRIRSSDHPDAQSIPIIALTANAFREDMEKAYKSGMNAHISKPIDMQQLLITVDTYLLG